MNSKNNTFDAIRFLEDHRIDHKTSGHKHCSKGWVQIVCPFCTGNPGFHLGFHLETGAINCRRCGKKKLANVIKALIPNFKATLSDIRAKYGSGGKSPLQIVLRPLTGRNIKLPTGASRLAPPKAIRYLIGRNYENIDLLIETWKLHFTGPTGPYKFRIIAPIYHSNRIVSYQGRDYTDNSILRYKACAKDDEIRDHQHCLYGEWLVKGDTVVVVEGIADAWRLGPGAVATFGIGFTQAQLNLLSRYKRVVMVFDSDPQAIVQAEIIGELLKILNPTIEVDIVEIEDGDPGELSQKEADELMDDLLGR